VATRLQWGPAAQLPGEHFPSGVRGPVAVNRDRGRGNPQPRNGL